MAQPSTLLSIVQRASDELTLPRPAVVIASLDPQIRQLLALLQEEGRYLMMAHEWSFLRTLYTFPTVASTATYAVPADFDRYINGTFWDQTNKMQVMGPDTAQADRWRQQSTTGQAGIRKNFRLVGSNIQLFPTPADVATIGYEYISNKWARSNASVAQTEFLADADTSLFDPYLMLKGLKWRFLSTKGLDAQVAQAEYQNYLDMCKGKDNTGETLCMGGQSGSPFLSLDNVPDSGYAV